MRAATLFLLRRICAGDQNRIAAMFAADLILHRGQRNLDPTATGRFEGSNETKRPLVNLNGRSDRDIPLLLPGRVDNDFVATLKPSSFFDCQSVERRVLIEWNSFDQARAKTRVAFVNVLTDRHGGADAFDA